MYFCRQCEAAKTDIIRATGNSKIHAFALDLASQVDVKRFAREVLQQFPQIHFLVNNAGTHGDIHCASPRRRDTADGYETIMATNYLGHFTLTYLLESLFINSIVASTTLLCQTNKRSIPIRGRVHMTSAKNFDLPPLSAFSRNLPY